MACADHRGVYRLSDCGKHFWMHDLEPDVEQLLAGRLKAFFFAELIGGGLVLGEEAPWQTW